MEKTAELGKAEVALVQAKANQLLSFSQIEKLRLKIKSEWKKPKRPSSYHGDVVYSRLKTPGIRELNLSQYRVNSVDRMRKLTKMKSIENQTQAIEKEFMTVIGKDERGQLLIQEYNIVSLFQNPEFQNAQNSPIRA